MIQFDWGEAPDVSVFIGRSDKLATLERDRTVDKGKQSAETSSSGRSPGQFAIASIPNQSWAA